MHTPVKNIHDDMLAHVIFFERLAGAVPMYIWQCDLITMHKVRQHGKLLSLLFKKLFIGMLSSIVNK
jgi:hypothetical protein